MTRHFLPLALAALLVPGAAFASCADMTTPIGETFLVIGAPQPTSNLVIYADEEDAVLIDFEGTESRGRPPLAAQKRLCLLIAEARLVGANAGDLRRHLILTHAHIDHHGRALGEAIDDLGYQIILHEEALSDLRDPDRCTDFDFAIRPDPSWANDLPDSSLTVLHDDMDLELASGEVVEIRHVDGGHTSGDLVVRFREANVIAAGDIFFHEEFPFIDLHNGGSVTKMVEALQTLADLADEETTIIPGHGPIATRADVLSTLEELDRVSAQIREFADQGFTVDEIFNLADPTADLDWREVLSRRRFIELVYFDHKGEPRNPDCS
ncbi:MAG: MBL fold metallo-hydrolase [Pseudomonadota bacterium]